MPDESILIADDEPDVLDMCVRVLSMEGYKVCGVHSGLEGIEMVQKQPFDLVLTDIKMPGMSGLQAFRTIKQYNPDIVGVAITGYGAVDTAIEALKLGMDDFLLKPFSLDELSAAISKALRKKRLERENARLKALIPLFQLSQAFMTVTDLDALLRQVMQVALSETAATLGVLALKNEASGNLDVSATVTESGVQPLSPDHRLSERIARQALETQEAVVWRAEPSEEPFFAAEKANVRIVTAVAIPLIGKGEIIGVLSLAKERADAMFAPSDVELLSVLASQAATAIQNARLFTRIRTAYEKLSKLDHLKSEFISIAAHELRTPLAEISTYMTLLDPDRMQEEERAYFAAIWRAADRLGLLMNDMTNLKYLEAGQIELKCTEVSLQELMTQVMEQAGPLAASRRQSITRHMPEGMPRIWADGPKIKTVLENLIANAMQFSPEEGKIRIEAEASDRGVRFAVRDTGVGIAQEEWEWIFKPFYQLESSLTREHGGIGVGLSIAKNLVELHGGRIWLESTVGEGSTFYFTIPDCLR